MSLRIATPEQPISSSVSSSGFLWGFTYDDANMLQWNLKLELGVREQRWNEFIIYWEEFQTWERKDISEEQMKEL